MKYDPQQHPGLGHAVPQQAQPPHARPAPAHVRHREAPPAHREIPMYAAPPGWTTSQRPMPMPQAFQAPATPEQERMRPTWPQQQAAIAHTQQASRPAPQASLVSGAEIGHALKLTDQQMQAHMGPIARRGYLYLTRFGSAMALLGAGGAAAGIVVGGAGVASGVGLPVGALAALGGVAVALGGLGGAALAGAAARSISRSTLRENPMLRQKMDTLRRMHGALSQKPARTPEENTLLGDVEAVLKRCDSSFSSALARTSKSAVKAPLIPLLGVGMLASFFGDTMSPMGGLFSDGTDLTGLIGGSDSHDNVGLALKGHEQFVMSPAMARWTHVLNAAS